MARLTPRDERLLQTLANYELLSTRQLLHLQFPGIRKATALRRLRKLEFDGLIRRSPGMPNGEWVWSLAGAGAARLQLEAYLANINRNSVEHDVTLNDVRLAFERMSLAKGWVAEQAIRRKADKQHAPNTRDPGINPDAVFVTTGDVARVVALELELSAKSPSRYRKIFRHYRVMQSLWALWYIVPSATLGRRLLDAWKKDHGYGYGKVEFYWLLLKDVLDPQMDIRLCGVDGDRLIKRPRENPAHPAAQGVSTTT